MIVAAVPDALTSGLVDVAADQAERLTTQAASLGAGELTRAAEVIATGLTDMRGTTAPRLHLELMRACCCPVPISTRSWPACAARSPGAAHRCDGSPSSSGPARPSVTRSEPAGSEGDSTAYGSGGNAVPAAAYAPGRISKRSRRHSGTGGACGLGAGTESAPAEAPVGSPSPTYADCGPRCSKRSRQAPLHLDLCSARMPGSPSSATAPASALSIAGARDSFARGGNEDALREAIVVVMGADFTVETMVDPSATPSAGASHASGRAATRSGAQQLTRL